MGNYTKTKKIIQKNIFENRTQKKMFENNIKRKTRRPPHYHCHHQQCILQHDIYNYT